MASNGSVLVFILETMETRRALAEMRREPGPFPCTYTDETAPDRPTVTGSGVLGADGVVTITPDDGSEPIRVAVR